MEVREIIIDTTIMITRIEVSIGIPEIMIEILTDKETINKEFKEPINKVNVPKSQKQVDSLSNPIRM
jgi:hypothetical protein